MNPEIIGLLAGSLTTLSFVPQVIRVFKTHSTKDISLGMYFLFCGGVILWIAYSYLIDSISVFLANIVTLLLAGSILVMKLIFKR
ncbi:MAG: SemiSWEET transporter [Alphaproteobacteria bacterium]|nr:SemiSWEET transporter [Alphaproteobacteria bacterium]